jgi:WD40 repeat protein
VPLALLLAGCSQLPPPPAPAAPAADPPAQLTPPGPGMRKGYEHVGRAVFSPDGKLVLGAYTFHEDAGTYLYDRRSLALWEVASGKQLWVRRDRELPAAYFAFLPGGKHFLATAGDKLLLCETASGKVVRTVTRAAERISCLAVSPDGGSALLGVPPGWVQRVDLPSGKAVRRYDVGLSAWALAVSPDGQRALVAALGGPADHSALLWDLPSGRAVRAFPWKRPGRACWRSPRTAAWPCWAGASRAVPAARRSC